MKNIDGSTNFKQHKPSKRRRGWELPQTTGPIAPDPNSPSATSGRNFAMEYDTPETEQSLSMSYACSERLLMGNTEGPKRILFADEKNQITEQFLVMKQQSVSVDRNQNEGNRPSPKVSIAPDDHDCTGTVIVTSKARPGSRQNGHLSQNASCDSQDSSCSHTTLSSLGSSAVYSPHRRLPRGHLSKTRFQNDPFVPTSQRFKVKHATARRILWAWTTLGILCTSSIMIYQSIYVEDFLRSQAPSFGSMRREKINIQSPSIPSIRISNLARVSSLPVAFPPKKKTIRHRTQSSEQSLIKPKDYDSDIGPETIDKEVVSPLSFVVQPPPLLSNLAKHADEARRVLAEQYDHGWSGTRSNDSPSNNASRVVYLHGNGPVNSVFVKSKHRAINPYPADFTDKTQLYGMLDSNDERVSGMEPRKPLDDGECIPMKEWQTHFYPSCNEIHSLGLEMMGDVNTPNNFDLFGTKGYWRNAWKVDALSNGHLDTVVLKTLKTKHNFEEAHFEHDRVDAVAMERLTFSDHVINIFGFCGHSVVTEYADGKRLGTLADKSKRIPLERLRIARDISRGLADVHSIDGDDFPATFVHLDINPANVVSIQGTLKLNDFNIGILRQWNKTSDEPCGFPAQYPNPQWRSPEEARNESELTEKVDLFSLGHIFFRLICGHEPWNKLEPGGKPSKESVTRAVQNGLLPTIPESVTTSIDPEVVAIRTAMLSCYTKDPTKRPSAREVAIKLQHELDRLEMNTINATQQE